MQKSHFLSFRLPTVIVVLLLAGCLTSTPVQEKAQISEVPASECPVCPACPETTPAVVADAASEVKSRLQVAEWRDLPGWQKDRPGEAWSAFLLSCANWERTQKGGVWEDWREVCNKAKRIKGGDEEVRRFFEAEFLPYAISEESGKDEGLITGYYEPLIKGSRQRNAQNNIPVLGTPPDMLTIDLGDLYPELKHRRLRGRVVGNRVVPYFSRAEIEDSADGNWPGKPLLWVADPIEFFFLQIQGSGRVQLPDGSQVRIGYADQNGHPYRSIGRVLIERGDLKAEEASMQGIQAWGRRNPERLRALLNENPSYVFFRELTEAARPDSGPLGAMGLPLTAGRSIAVDPRYVTLGVPVWLATTYPNSGDSLNRLVVAQDTGGAIKGVVRADFFWGFGDKAGQQAGRMKQRGRMWLILPRTLSP